MRVWKRTGRGEGMEGGKGRVKKVIIKREKEKGEYGKKNRRK